MPDGFNNQNGVVLLKCYVDSGQKLTKKPVFLRKFAFFYTLGPSNDKKTGQRKPFEERSGFTHTTAPLFQFELNSANNTVMERKEFLKTIFSGALGMTTLSAFNTFTNGLSQQDEIMPVLFIGHGSPMNGIEDNHFSRNWKQIAKDIPQPKAVLVISAHWLTKGTHITAMDFPKTIHDFGGFPDELYQVEYKAPGSPALANETAALVKTIPNANIPVLQLSIDYTKGPQYHYDLARELYDLRKKGVLILGSGNMVHNLRMVAWDKLAEDQYGFDWAIAMNNTFKDLIATGKHDVLINYESLGRDAKLAIPTPDHYWPLLYTLGVTGGKDQPSFFNDKVVGGSLTMTSVKFSQS
jgi:4,5-DOPA dioxygenase extradiol